MKTLYFLLISLAIYTISNAQWTQIGQDIDGEAADDESGCSVSINSDGTIIAIGAHANDGNGDHSGQVRIYEYNSGTWTQLGNDIDGDAPFDWSGKSVSLSSDGYKVAIGAPYNDGGLYDAGQVRIFEYSGGNWIQLGNDIYGEAESDGSGLSISLNSDGSIVAIGASVNDGNGNMAGHVRVYEYNGTSWQQLGADIDGEAAEDRFGFPVSLSSNGYRLAAGAENNDGNGNDAGHVRVYEYSGGNWIQLGVDIDGEAANDHSGQSVSLSSDGSIVAIGAIYNNDNGSIAGHVRVYQYSGGNWQQLGQDIDGEAASDQSGYSISLSSDGYTVAIGAPFNDGNGNDAGHVRVYEYNGTSWQQLGADIDGEAAEDRSSLWALSLSSDGSHVAIGALQNDGNGNDAGHVRIYSQTYLISDGGTLNTCSGTFYDSGGQFGSYLNNEDYTITFCAPAGQVIIIDFTDIDIGRNDHFIIHDGTSISDPVLYDISNSAGVLTVASTSECLTFHFTSSDPTDSDTGWIGNISCANQNPCLGFSVDINIINNATCGTNTGYAEAVITGGTAPFTYNWSNSDTTDYADSLAAGMYTLQVTDDMGCYAMQSFMISSAGGPTLNYVSYDLACYGGNTGSIDLTITGGVQPYDINWSNGAITEDISNLAFGNYQVMVTDDNGCMAYTTVGIFSPPPIQISLINTDPSCSMADGEILANVSGGTPAYTYNWSNATTSNPATGLMYDMYYLTVTDNNGCTEVAATSLSNTNAPVITLESITSAGCGTTDGGIDVTVTGGVIPLTYSWSNSSSNEDLTGVAPGFYELTVSDANGCYAVFGAEVLGIEPLEQPICVVMVDTTTGTNLVVWERVQATGIDHYNIYRESWYIGQYDFIASVPADSMSEYTDPIANPMIRSWRYKISAVDACGNESPLSDYHKTIHLITNQGLGQTYNLIWDHYEGFFYPTYYIYRHLNSSGWILKDSVPANITMLTDNPPSQGGLRYIVTVNTPAMCVPTSSTKANGGPYSQSTSNLEDDGIISGISYLDDANIVVYPNPNSGRFTVQSSKKIIQVTAVDVLGREVCSVKPGSTRVDLDLDVTGIIFIQVFTEQGQYISKVIVE